MHFKLTMKSNLKGIQNLLNALYAFGFLENIKLLRFAKIK